MQTQTERTADDVRGKAEETASVIAREAQETATVQLTSQKERAVSTLDTLAQTLRDSGQNLRTEQPQIASLTDEAARRVESASNYVREHDVKDLVREVEGFARREPALFLGGAFAIGFLAARFLKASSPSRGAHGRDSSGDYAGGRYAGYNWQPTGAAGTGYGASSSAHGTSNAGAGLGSDIGRGAGVTGEAYGASVGAGSGAGVTGQAYGGTVGYGDTERYGVGADMAAAGSEYDRQSGVDATIDHVDELPDDAARYDESNR